MAIRLTHLNRRKLFRNFMILPYSLITYSKQRPYSKFCLSQQHHIKNVNYSSLIKHFPRLYSKVNPNICWNCESDIDNNLFCFKCNKLQKVKEQSNYFKIMGITEKFDVDSREVTQRYRHLQTLLHPDKFATKSEEEKNISMEWSTVLNKAYSTLQHPLKRGLHLLELNGQSIEQEQTSPELLAKILTKFEEAEAANNTEAVNELRDTNMMTIQELCDKISLAFQKGDITKAKDLLLEMKYYSSIHKDLKEKLEQMSVQ